MRQYCADDYDNIVKPAVWNSLGFGGAAYSTARDELLDREILLNSDELSREVMRATVEYWEEIDAQMAKEVSK